MLIPVPIGAEATVSRIPYATALLIIFNVLVFAATRESGSSRTGKQIAEVLRLADWELQKEAQKTPEISTLREQYPTAMALIARDQSWQELITDDSRRDRLLDYLEEYESLTKTLVSHRYGFQPTDITVTRLFAHMFLHADFFHLFFNMLFLYAVACVLEDTWGIPLFVLLYVVFGLAAALAHAIWLPDSIEPVIGASGAVAGLMGAFAVQHGRTRIQLALIYSMSLVPKVKVVSMPGAIILGLWLLQQLFWATLTTQMNLGVAFWGHIGGFTAGVAAAVAYRFTSSRDETIPN